MRYLTDNEELAILQLCHLLGSMGYGITCDKLQEIVSNLTNFDVYEQEIHKVSDKVVRGLFINMVTCSRLCRHHHLTQSMQNKQARKLEM